MQEILEGLPDPMQINMTLVVIIGIFLVLIFILNTMIFKPLVAKLDERAHRIKEGAEARENALRTVEESEARYQSAMIDARRKAQAKRQEMLKETQALREEKIAAARAEASGMTQKVTAELEKQVSTARADMERETRQIAERIAARVLSRAS
ncbi:MAG: hypothetical protein QNK37_09700 [Acidobacteriota bacterium]|nr:hypothetical protein [Acidobacteriota bacterium]